MTRKGQKQKGQFDVKPGMVFTMPNMPNISRKYGIGADKHPWLILKTYDDYIEVVMCSTLWSNKENKHRTSSLNYENVTDIINPCPPMDRPQIRMSKVSLDTFTLIKKKDLFSNELQIWNNNTPQRNFTTENTNSLCLDQNELSNLRKEVLQYLSKHPQINYDPWECEEFENNLYNLQDGLPVPKGFTQESYDKQFAWQHIKPANPYAVYPFEDQMYDYEKKDKQLLNIAKQKKKGTNHFVKDTNDIALKLHEKIQKENHKKHPNKSSEQRKFENNIVSSTYGKTNPNTELDGPK